jgi:hypothetical protein
MSEPLIKPDSNDYAEKKNRTDGTEESQKSKVKREKGKR